MRFEERLHAHPEVLMPLWGAAWGRRDRDRDAVRKSAFWRRVVGARDAMMGEVAERAATPPNVRRASRMVASAEAAADRAERDELGPMRSSMALHEPTLNVRGVRRRAYDTPASLDRHLEEVSAQMILRPLPRVEKEVEAEIEWAYRVPERDAMTEDIEDARRDVLASLTPRFVPATNLDVMRAHRRFHNRLLHETPWAEHLAADEAEEGPGPLWTRVRWDGWEPLLDPIPRHERPAASGLLFDRDRPVPDLSLADLGVPPRR